MCTPQMQGLFCSWKVCANEWASASMLEWGTRTRTHTHTHVMRRVGFSCVALVARCCVVSCCAAKMIDRRFSKQRSKSLLSTTETSPVYHFSLFTFVLKYNRFSWNPPPFSPCRCDSPPGPLEGCRSEAWLFSKADSWAAPFLGQHFNL